MSGEKAGLRKIAMNAEWAKDGDFSTAMQEELHFIQDPSCSLLQQRNVSELFTAKAQIYSDSTGLKYAYISLYNPFFFVIFCLRNNFYQEKKIPWLRCDHVRFWEATVRVSWIAPAIPWVKLQSPLRALSLKGQCSPITCPSRKHDF